MIATTLLCATGTALTPLSALRESGAPTRTATSAPTSGVLTRLAAVEIAPPGLPVSVIRPRPTKSFWPAIGVTSRRDSALYFGDATLAYSAATSVTTTAQVMIRRARVRKTSA